jgi:chaperonin GroES
MAPLFDSTAKNMNYPQPQEDRVLILEDAPESTTTGGILLPQQAQKRTQIGTVVAAGPGKTSEHTGQLMPMNFKEGDRVLMSKFSGTAIDWEGEELWVMRQSDVMVKLNA